MRPAHCAEGERGVSQIPLSASIGTVQMIAQLIVRQPSKPPLNQAICTQHGASLHSTAYPQDYKDYMDAENLMPLPTSDVKNPICLEMRLLRSEMEAVGGGGPMEMGSVDSSDTFTSCNTQPFNSHMDLTTEDPTALGCDSSNLYINPLESARGVVKKSISRDSGLRNLGNSLIDEESRFPSSKRSSRGSLNEDSLPKHRRTRFQQVLNQNSSQ